MSKKLLALSALIVMSLLSGCSKARNPQCQDLADKYDGSLIGGVLGGGGYAASFRADMAEAQLNQCEMAFDLIKQQQQYQQQLQDTALEARREQIQMQEQAQQQERQRLMKEKIKSPEMQKLLRKQSLADLVDCEKGIGKDSDKFPPDVKAMVSRACVGEIDRRVDTGKVSRAKVDKMINQSS
ncbi:hypothetical protein [Lelliottia nimipressuralis]|uniref:Lipoprotein n=1 Tax=Lelliottia nimipressuralis TaxID=69220 RepID=A0ABD4K5U2_9ENTR|nr:hypothetical protein [Lelliottia nimipressuralis]MBF4177263.1 hypothetical protein [Lelliottia nimipressuralis]